MCNNILEPAPGMERDYQDGIKWWEGNETEQDFVRAAACLERAAVAGHAGAKHYLALLSYYAFEDDERALYWARRAAEAGDEAIVKAAQKLIQSFTAPPLPNDAYYFKLFLQSSSYDHVVYSDLSCDWRNEIGRARTCAREMAEALGLNGDKAEALAAFKGRAQLPFGPSGAAYIRELALREGFDFDELSLCHAIMRNSFVRHFNMGIRMTEDLLGAIAALYREEEQEKQRESGVVAGVYKMLGDYALLRKNGAMTEEEWEEKYRKAIEASAKAKRPLPFASIAKSAGRYVFTPPVLPDAEREFLDIVWAHYREFGAQGIELVRQVTASVDQGMRVADIRRLGRKTPDGRRIQTYEGGEAPEEYKLIIHARSLHSDLVYGGEKTIKEIKAFPLRLGERITVNSMEIGVVELLCADGEFTGAVLDISHPSDVRSLTRNERREILLAGQCREYGYGGGNDDFDLHCGFSISIKKQDAPA